MQTQNKPAIQYVAEVSPVKEVTLHGQADLSFWQQRLAAEELEPLPRDGQAQLFLSATEARFKGIRFRECIIGLHVRSANELPAMYLMHAWNSLRAFAWIERNLFGTPYYPGQIEVEPQRPARMQLSERGQTLIAARMPEPRAPAQVAEENWQGAIYLPRRNNGPQKLFIAKLAGLTEQYPFDAASDTFTLTGTPNCPTLGWLLDSHFVPLSWHVRQTGTHAKSKTYRADQFTGIR